MTRNQCFVLLSATLTIFGFGPWGCIDVGHPSEIGCLVDMEEPGCNRPEGTGGKPSVNRAVAAAALAATQAFTPLILVELATLTMLAMQIPTRSLDYGSPNWQHAHRGFGQTPRPTRPLERVGQNHRIISLTVTACTGR